MDGSDPGDLAATQCLTTTLYNGNHPRQIPEFNRGLQEKAPDSNNAVDQYRHENAAPCIQCVCEWLEEASGYKSEECADSLCHKQQGKNNR